jgi:EEF1A lysine methyltransferase 2
VLYDKGTYDAISLSPEDAAGKRAQYRSMVHEVCLPINALADANELTVLAQMLLTGGLFIITSCNWTEAELVSFFADDAVLCVRDRIEYPVFRFGGRSGQQVSTVIFGRV